MALKIRPFFKRRGAVNHGSHASGTSYLPSQVASIYGLPAPRWKGPKQGIALIELGGGFAKSDVVQYAKAAGFPAPPVHFISIDGAKNSPDGPDGAQGEVMLDICVAGGITQGSVPLFVVTAPNTTAGFAAAIQWAATAPQVTVVSISWGGPENTWPTADVATMGDAIDACNAAGKPVFVAAGDNGSGDGETGNNVDFPASYPGAIGCGGTTLQPNGTETVWNDGSQGGATGGGLSTLFGIQPYQFGIGVPGNAWRGVPDVSGVADPNTGYEIMIDGQMLVYGGTSAVAPLWAGIASILGQYWVPLKSVAQLYSAGQKYFKDITVGNNGTYVAKKGYDCCTGLGSPNGATIASLSRAAPNPVGQLITDIEAAIAALKAKNIPLFIADSEKVAADLKSMGI